MITAREVSAALGIPIATVYRLARDNQIPFEDVTRPWHHQKKWRFRLSEVEQAIKRIESERA